MPSGRLSLCPKPAGSYEERSLRDVPVLPGSQKMNRYEWGCGMYVSDSGTRRGGGMDGWSVGRKAGGEHTSCNPQHSHDADNSGVYWQ